MLEAEGIIAAGAIPAFISAVRTQALHIPTAGIWVMRYPTTPGSAMAARMCIMVPGTGFIMVATVIGVILHTATTAIITAIPLTTATFHCGATGLGIIRLGTIPTTTPLTIRRRTTIPRQGT